MIDHLVAWKRISTGECVVDLPHRLLVGTDHADLARHANAIIAIVRRHLQHSGHLWRVG